MFLHTLVFLSGIAFGQTNASSTLKHSKKEGHKANITYTPQLAVDGRLGTAWAESANGNGTGQWFELNLRKSTEIKTLSIWPGNLTNGISSFVKHARPKMIRILVDGKEQGEPRRLQDKAKRYDFEIDATGKSIRIVVDDAFEGIMTDDMYITEVAVNFHKRDGILKRIDKWANGKSAKKADAAFNKKIEKLFFEHFDSNLNAPEALAKICDFAADGAPYQRAKAKSAPAGYRIQALDSHAYSRKALRKLNDANAIPCLEKAALRASSRQAKTRWSNVEYFYASRELTGGPNYNVKAWGGEGWSKGELQSFGEPLPMEIDAFGDLWVVDSGNNRIQIFDERGRSKKSIGGIKPEIAEDWYEKRRSWYVSGSKPGKKGQHLTVPIDIAFIPEKEGKNGFAVFEADGRIAIWNSKDKNPLISWKTDFEEMPQKKMGGSGYLVYLSKRDLLCAISNDKGACYKRDGEKINDWDIKDGIPTSVVGYDGKKLLMSFNDKVLFYSHTGFQERSIINKKTLGSGFEYLDMSFDENGKLWVVTDAGDAFKFKLNSFGLVWASLEYKIRAINRPIQFPRIAVQDDVLYLLSDNKIDRVDIRQMKLDEEDAKEGDKEE